MPKRPRPTVQDAQEHVKEAAQKMAAAGALLREARDELVRALLVLGSPRRSDRGHRPVLFPLTVLSVVSSAFDLLMPLSARLETLATATPEKVEAEWRDVVLGIFGE